MIFSLVHDFAGALAALPAAHPRRRVLVLLDEAIRRDAHFIDRHPTTLFQCLWNSCWWYDCPQAVQHEQRSPADFARGLAVTAWRWITRWVHARNEGVDRAPALFEILEDWLVRRELHTPGARWVRALRPPPVALGRPFHVVIRGERYVSARFSPDEQEIGAVAHEARPGSDAETVIHVFDTGSGRRLRTVAGLFAPVRAAAAQPDWPLACAPLFRVVASPDGRYCARVEGSSVEVRDSTTRSRVLTLDGNMQTAEHIAWSPESSTIATAGRYRILLVWDWPSGALRYRVDDTEVHVLEFSPCGNYLAVGRYPEEAEIAELRAKVNDHSGLVPGAVDVRRAGDGTLIHRFGVPGMGAHGRISALAFSPDGRHLAAGGKWRGHAVLVWDVQTGRQTHELVGHGGAVGSAAFNTDGSRLLTAGDDVRVWDWKRGGHGRKLSGHAGDVHLLDVSPDGSRVISAGAETWVGAWSGETGRLLARLHLSNRTASTAKFSAAGTWFAALSYHGRSTAAWHSRSLWPKLMPQADLERFLFDEPNRPDRYALASDDVGAVLLSDSKAPMAWIGAMAHMKSDSVGRVWAGSTGNYVGIFRLEGEI